MSRSQVNLAIRDCLSLCHSEKNPGNQIATFVAGLRSAGWTEEDIRSVEVIVTKTLRAIADSAEPGEDTRRRRTD